MQENTKRRPKAENALHDSLALRITQGGPITVAGYMSTVVEEYYKTQDPFGASGDFTTAPEISQMFGEMIGAWLVDLWMQMGKPESVKLVELGPGRGTLAADIMRTISMWPDFKEAVTLHLVETSLRLRDIQAATLKGYRAGWYDSFGDVPEGITFVIANEFFDALPIHQFKKTEQGWQERCIDYDAEKDSFFFTTRPTALSLKTLMPEEFMNAPTGSFFEISPASLTVVKDVAERIRAHGGAALFIDYGHMKAGLGETLQAVSRHCYVDPLENPGVYDVTAHVDFGTLKTVAEPLVAVAGPVTQGQFLIALGIEERAERICKSATDSQREEVMAALCRLVARKDMGRLFKVMALVPRQADIVPAGFGLGSVGDDELSDH